MRASVLLALLTALSLGAAHAQTPDPTDPARYYPLDIGNVWEYESRYGLSTPSDMRMEIVRDTVIDGETYWIESHSSGPPGGALDGAFETLMRFDAEIGRLVFLFAGDTAGTPVYPVECSFDVPFGPNQTCANGILDIRGGLAGTVTLSDSSRIQVAAVKAYATPPPFPLLFDTYAADVGLVHQNDWPHGGGGLRLRYARIRGVEIGTRFPVTAEAPPAAEALMLRTLGRSLVLTARDAGPVRVDLFDTLGRRVATLFDARLGAEARTLSLPEVASGVYIARAIQGTDRASVRVVVAR